MKINLGAVIRVAKALAPIIAAGAPLVPVVKQAIRNAKKPTR